MGCPADESRIVYLIDVRMKIVGDVGRGGNGRLTTLGGVSFWLLARRLRS